MYEEKRRRECAACMREKVKEMGSMDKENV